MIAASAADYREALPMGGRLMGLDVGTRTIGIAFCDAGWTIATPAELLKRAKFSADLAKLRALAETQQARGLVIGLPLNMDGSDSPRTQSVRAFARNAAPLGLPVLLWDERWSTQAVTRTLIDAEPPRTERAPTLPSTPTERTPAPWPHPDLRDTPRAPESPTPPTPAPVEAQPLTIAVPSGW